MASELDRLYRVAKQTLSMHCDLRDQYLRWALAFDVVILTGSAVFCATRFAGDDLFQWAGVVPKTARLWLSVAATASFVASIIVLRVDWKGRAALHREACSRWAVTLRAFREARTPECDWSGPGADRLSDLYWECARSSPPIPERRFVALKARHLAKVEASRLQDAAPGCPGWLARVIVSIRGSAHALRAPAAGRRE